MREPRRSSRCSKCRYYCRAGTTSLMSHFGLCSLVVGYCVMGAFLFEYLEATNERNKRLEMMRWRSNLADALWELTAEAPLLDQTNWTGEAVARLRRFEVTLVQAVRKEGYDGKEDAQLQWSFTGALLYSIIVITTIDLRGKLPAVCSGDFWTIKANDRCVMFFRIEDNPSTHVRFSVTVFADLSLAVSAGMIKLASLPCGGAVPDAVRDIRTLSLPLRQLGNQMRETPGVASASKTATVLQHIGSLLNELSQDSGTTEEHCALFRLLNEQIALALAASIRRYSAETLVFSSILNSISPHAFNFARSASTLTSPHPATLRRVCSKYGGDPLKEQNEATFLSYVRERVKSMQPHEKTVTLMVDEIYIKPYFDYKGGNIVGSEANSQEAATTAHVSMVQSLLSSSKDVLHILPVSKVTVEILHDFCKKIIL
ncbi:hypothetical protein HPB49_018722 [Dermacentor silvarum]|uniref:Uncharacterized protein n=1 Tax=Dermacentor silvarum TaxID=543639 RepID=A0ACB8D794_DERSI|nr:hypothetical protein HPB49_018722 [Dermacentor silvarum]